MIKRFLACFTIFVMSFSCLAFAAEPDKSNALRTDGYTYWKITSTPIGEENGEYHVIHRGPGGDTYQKKYVFTITETISASAEVGILEAIKAMLKVNLGGSFSKEFSFSGKLGGENYDPKKTYELRAWPVYDKYSTKGKEYIKIDGYEQPTGKSYGYPGDKEGAKIVKKFRTVAHRADFEV